MQLLSSEMLQVPLVNVIIAELTSSLQVNHFTMHWVVSCVNVDRLEYNSLSVLAQGSPGKRAVKRLCVCVSL